MVLIKFSVADFPGTMSFC